MIGKSLNARFGNLANLTEAEAASRLEELLRSPERAEDIVRVRTRNPAAVAVVVSRADAGAIRACRSLGLDVKPGGTAVFGLVGSDAARVFPALTETQRTWLEGAASARETKVILLASGIALLSLVAEAGKVAVASVA